MRKLSVSICLTMRQRVAPSAPRMASSRARKAARPNCMFITFTQAIRRTTMTAPSIAYMIWRQLLAGERLEEWLHAGGDEMLVGLRIVLRDPFGEADELRVDLVLGHTRFESAHDRGTDAGGIAARLERKLVVKRHPKLFVLRELKIRRHDADNGGGLAIDPDCLADDMRVAIEIAFPDFVARGSSPSPRPACCPPP